MLYTTENQIKTTDYKIIYENKFILIYYIYIYINIIIFKNYGTWKVNKELTNNNKCFYFAKLIFFLFDIGKKSRWQN